MTSGELEGETKLEPQERDAEDRGIDEVGAVAVQDSALTNVLDAFLEEVIQGQLATLDRLDEQVLGPVRIALTEAAARHQKAKEILEGASEGATPAAAEAAYRSSVSQEILRPLLTTLKEADPGESVRQAFRPVDDSAAELARQLPAELGEPSVRLARTRGGPPHLRRVLRKLVTRSFRQARAPALEAMASGWLSTLRDLGEALTVWMEVDGESATAGLQDALERAAEGGLSTADARETLGIELAKLAVSARDEAVHAESPAPSEAAVTLGLADSPRGTDAELSSSLPQGMVAALRGAVGRVEAVAMLTDFRCMLDAFLVRHLGADLLELCSQVEGPLRSAEARIRELFREAETVFPDQGGEVELAAGKREMARRVEGLMRNGRREIAGLKEALEKGDSPGRLEALAGSLVEELTDHIGQLPDALDVLERSHPEEPLEPEEIVSLDLREWAARAFDVYLLDRVRDALIGVSGLQRSAWEEASGADGVLVYNLEAAVEELSADPPPENLDTARELVLGGLDRTADHLGRVAGDLELLRESAAKVVYSNLDDGWRRLQLRLAQEGLVEGYVADVLTDLVKGALGTSALLRQGGRSAAAFAGAVVRVAAIRAQRLVKRGRRLVGIEPIQESGLHGTLRGLSQIDVAAASLPFVYRRLFSTRSITDPSLLAGRDGDIEALENLWVDRKGGRRTAVAVTGPFGGTLRSLVTAFQSRVTDSPEIVRIPLETRILDEPVLAKALAEGTGVDPGDLLDLGVLADRIGERPPEPTIVCVERLEHLFLRSVGGSRLVAKALEFFSRTDGPVFWILLVSREGWEIIRRVEPAAVRLVEVHAVKPLEAEELEQCIMVRHGRSGLPLSFVPGDSPPVGLARALSSSKSEEERQHLLREAFFSDLFDLTDGSVPLALLYWLRSINFDPARESIEVALPQAMDFGFLEAMSWDEVFALDAFMEHGTFSVEEHAEVFGTSVEDSLQVLESLGNLLLIEPVGASRRVGQPLAFGRVEASVRYRIRPVFVPIVRRVLRGRNLLD